MQYLFDIDGDKYLHDQKTITGKLVRSYGVVPDGALVLLKRFDEPHQIIEHDTEVDIEEAGKRTGRCSFKTQWARSTGS